MTTTFCPEFAITTTSPHLSSISSTFSPEFRSFGEILTHDLEDERIVQWPVTVLTHHNVVRLAANRRSVLEPGRGENHLTDGLERAVVLQVLFERGKKPEREIVEKSLWLVFWYKICGRCKTRNPKFSYRLSN